MMKEAYRKLFYRVYVQEPFQEFLTWLLLPFQFIQELSLQEFIQN